MKKVDTIVDEEVALLKRVQILTEKRQRAVRRLAQWLARVGPYHPTRALENKRRAALRKAIRAEIRACDKGIVAAMCQLLEEPDV